MVKDTNNESLLGITETSMEITKKKKKKKKKNRNSCEEQNLVPSAIDPLLFVPAAKDHRVNLDGVLDERMQSKIDEWLDNELTFSEDELAHYSTAMYENFASGKKAATTLEENVVATHIQANDIPPKCLQVKGHVASCSKAKAGASIERKHKKTAKKKLKLAVSSMNRMNSPSRTFIAGDNAGKFSAAACSTDSPAVQPVAGTVHAYCTPAATVPADCTPAATVPADTIPAATVSVLETAWGSTSKPTKSNEIAGNQPPNPSIGRNDIETNSNSNSNLNSTKPVKGGNEKLNFAGLFKENRLQGNGFKLSFHEFTSDEAMLDESDEVPLVENWGYCLIGCFTGLFPGRQALDNIVKGWGVQCRYFPYAKGWTVFRFMNDADRIKILYGGPYVAYGKTLMLKIIDEGTMLSDDLFMKIPTWVLLHEVPLIVWSESGLSKLSSKVGTPLYTDKVTKDRSKMNYARCLIEVDVSKSPILEFPVIMSKSRRYVQKVSYEHFPDYCCDCRKFGHNVFNCPKKASAKVVLEVPPKPIHGSKNATVFPTIGKNIAKEPKKINVKVTTPTDKSTRGKAPIHAPTTNLAVAAPIEKGETSGTCHSEAIHGGSSNVTNCDGTMVQSTVFVVPEDARSSHATVGATQLIATDDIPLSHWVKVGNTPKKKGRGRASSSFVSKR